MLIHRMRCGLLWLCLLAISCIGVQSVHAEMLYHLTFEDEQGQSTLASSGSVPGEVTVARKAEGLQMPEIVFEKDTPDQSAWSLSLKPSVDRTYLGPALVMPDSQNRLQLSEAKDEMTIALWVKWNGRQDNGPESGLAGKWNRQTGWSWYINKQGQMTFMLKTKSDATWSRHTQDALKPGVWTHVALVIDNDSPKSSKTEGGIQFYINGKVSALSQVINGIGDVITPVDHPMFVGTGLSNNARPVNGCIDDVQIHDKALTPEAIAVMSKTQSRHVDPVDDPDHQTDKSARQDNTSAQVPPTAAQIVLPMNAKAAAGGVWTCEFAKAGSRLVLAESKSRLKLDQDGDAMTFSAWINWQGGQGPQCIIGKRLGDAGWLCRILSDGKLEMQFRTKSQAMWGRKTVAGIAPNQWTHIAWVVDTAASDGTTCGSIQFYINGIMSPLSQPIGNLGDVILGTDAPVVIGAGISGYGSSLDSPIKAIELHESALTPQQIYTLAGRPGKPLAIEDYITSENGKQIIALQMALYVAYAQGSKLSLPAGTYHMDTAGVQFNNIGDFVLEGSGKDETTLVLDHADSPALRIFGCRNLTIQNLSIGLDPIPIVQGTITAITPQAGRFVYDFKTHEGYPQLTPENMARFHACSCFFSGENDELIADAGWFGAQAQRNVIRIDDTHGQLLYGKVPVKVGDKIGLPLKGSGFPINIRHSESTRLDHVALLASSSLGIAAHFVTGDNYLRVQIKRAPKPAGATVVPLFSTNADGIQYFFSPGSLTMEQCDFGYMGDDGVNISSPPLIVLQADDPTQVRVIFSGGSALKEMIKMSREGDRVLPRRYGSFDPLPDCRLISVQYDGPLLGALPKTIMEHYSEIGRPLPGDWHVATLQLDQSAMGKMALQVGDYLVFRRFFPKSYTIRNSRFHHTRARGLLLMAPDGMVENNVIDGIYLQGILMGNEFPYRFADWVTDVVVRNNTVTNTMFCKFIGPDSSALGAIQLGYCSHWRNMKYPWGMGNRNVRIVNNTIDTTSIAGIFVNGLVDGVVQGNRISNSQLKYGADAGHHYKMSAPYAITLMNCQQVKVSNNLVSELGPYAKGDWGDLGIDSAR